MLTLDPLVKLNQFFARFKSVSYKKRETILRPTDNPTGIFYVEKGFVRQYIISADGKELTTIIYKSDDLFPIRWAIADMPLESYFEAVTALLLKRAPKEEFLSFLKDEPQVFFVLTSRIINRLYAILERMEYLAFGNSDNKIASLLLLLAQRFGKRKRVGTVIELPLTHQDIAALLGLTRETVSINMKRLKDLAIIGHFSQMIVVRSMRRLEQESSLL